MSKPIIRVYHPPADARKVARWNANRRRHDRVDELEEGFTFRASGRQGYIYHREGTRILELYWEMSGVDEYDILLSLDGLQEWALPHVEPIEPVKQQEILAALRDWLAANKVRALIEEPRP